MNETNAKKKRIYGAIAAALVLAAALLLILSGGSHAPVFAEFSAPNALDGAETCYLNALAVLDRYAEQPDREAPAELLLASFRAADETEVLVSVLTEPDDPLYARLSPYYRNDAHTTKLIELSGYFFCEPLNRHNKGASEAFLEDAAAYTEWRQDAHDAVSVPVVLRFAGETETAYEAALREQNRGTVITIVALFVLAAACGVRILTLRKPKRA